MPRSSCSRAGPFIAPDRATGEEGSRRRCVWGTAGCGWVLPCVRAKHKAGGEAGGRKEDGERGNDSPFPSGLSASREERTHNKYG